MKLIYLLASFVFAADILFSATAFNDINAGLPALMDGFAACADYDNDGDIDFLITGSDNGGVLRTYLYRNDSGVFNQMSTSFANVNRGAGAWADYDNDGDQDLLLTGHTGGTAISKIYRNDGSENFTDIDAGLFGLYFSSVAWGDYDNDGDPDALIAGFMGGAYLFIYRNDGSDTFTDIGVGLEGAYLSSVAWGDYDLDSDLDILITGHNGSEMISKIYKNEGAGVFTPITDGLPDVYGGSVRWGDYDNDGDPDILLTGFNGLNVTEIYRNEGGVFTDIDAGLKELASGSGSWGDFDFDGDLDILLSGESGSNTFTKIYRNDGGIFTEINASINGVSFGSSVWIDFDKDHDLDVLITGYCSAISGRISLLYRTDMDFNRIDSGFPDVWCSSTAWGDYDNDGDLDLLISGNNPYGILSKVYRNDGGLFTDINAALDAAGYTSSAWIDYDCDGDLDIIISGNSYGTYITRIYKNDAGTFTDINAGLAGVHQSSVSWADFDGDGDPDLLLSGNSGGVPNPVTKVYRNDRGTFTDYNTGIPAVYSSGSSWCDYDCDGDPDIFVSGTNGASYSSEIYQNNGGIFTGISAGLLGVMQGSSAWGDYDNDGDPDLLLTGFDGLVRVSLIYRNNSGLFTDIGAGLTGVYLSSCAWGDFDSDGDSDIIISGDSASGYVTKMYRNNSGVFAETEPVLPGGYYGSVSWADYDNDNDLDFVLTGTNGRSNITYIYRNNCTVKNTNPSKPSKLVTNYLGNVLRMSFDPSSDAQTPQNGLTYNLNLVINGETVISSMSGLADGFRKIPAAGNLGSNKYCELGNFRTDLPQIEKRTVWKVQSVDQMNAGSPFAATYEFAFDSPDELAIYSKDPMTDPDMLKWDYLYPEFIDYYIVQIDDDQYFNSPIEQTITSEKTVKNSNGKIMLAGIQLSSLNQYNELENAAVYYWRMKPVYTGINRFTRFTEIPLSFVYIDITHIAPNPPVSGFNPANDDIESDLPMLSWNNAVDPDGHAEDLYYICQLDTVNTFGTIQYADTTAAGVTSVHVVSALTEGYRYYYRIKTVDADGLQSGWSGTQSFIVVMPPQDVKISDNGTNVNLIWDAVPINSKGIVYTVYSSGDPNAVFPSGWTISAVKLTANSWSEPHSATKKFYRITVGSGSK